MKKNYEIKYELDSKKSKEIKAYLKNFKYSVEKQVDVYFEVADGRLKLRIINDTDASLIFYDRGEKTGKRISKYTISKTKDFNELKFILRKHFKISITVNKRREIFIFKNIRVHLDKVTGLGKFLEIEIIYTDLAKAKIQMKELISRLTLDENKFIKESYSDLLINRT